MINLLKEYPFGAKEIPKNPGCYLFKNKSGKVIYVGKAKSLSKRVRNYFQSKDHDAKTLALVSNIVDVEFFITDTETEALVLENNLIKKYYPRYNINLKDSKRYAYIQVTDEEFPRLLVSRKRSGGGKFYGPFVSAQNRDYILEALKRIFKIRTCKKLPKRLCIRYSIGLCSGPCTGQITREDYLESVRAAEFVLKGRTKKLIELLHKNMKEASARQRYEKALEYKNQIEAIRYLEEKQNVERQKTGDEDIINYVVFRDVVHLYLFSSRKGILNEKQEFEFEYTPNFLEDFLNQYYSENYIPNEIILPEKVEGNFEDHFSKLSKRKVKLHVPLKGEKKDLVELVKKNIEVVVFGDSERVEDLKLKLKLNESPKVIECFDISHLSGTSTVASMVQFRNGKPDKNNYRKYKIRTVEGIDDFASMKEVVRRRYTKLKFEKLPFPNLVVIDGGKGQLSAVMETLEEIGVKIPIISLAKREEEIFLPRKSNPIILDRKGKALKLLMGIRDEAHRFAINYNRLLRKKKLRES